MNVIRKLFANHDINYVLPPDVSTKNKLEYQLVCRIDMIL